MNKRKTRFFRFLGATFLVVLAGCILFICVTLLRDNESTSNDVALEMKPAGTETKTTGTYGAGHKPSFGHLWSRSEVFMY